MRRWLSLHEHYDVVDIHLIVFRLRDGFEIHFVAEYYFAFYRYFSFDRATMEGVAGESIIHNSLDVFIVFLLVIPP